MLIYYYLIVFIVILLIILLFRTIVLRKKNIPANLFTEALRNENSGQFEAAIISYQAALDETKKIWVSKNFRKSKIIEKLKILHSVLKYKNGFHSGR